MTAPGTTEGRAVFVRLTQFAVTGSCTAGATPQVDSGSIDAARIGEPASRLVHRKLMSSMMDRDSKIQLIWRGSSSTSTSIWLNKVSSIVPSRTVKVLFVGGPQFVHWNVTGSPIKLAPASSEKPNASAATIPTTAAVTTNLRRPNNRTNTACISPPDGSAHSTPTAFAVSLGNSSYAYARRQPARPSRPSKTSRPVP